MNPIPDVKKNRGSQKTKLTSNIIHLNIIETFAKIIVHFIKKKLNVKLNEF